MGSGRRLVPKIVPGDWNGLAHVIAKLDHALNTGSAPTFQGITLNGLSPLHLVATDVDTAFESTDLASWVAGTTNQVIVVDDSDGTITLSTPQDIHTGANPTFAGLVLSDEIVFSADAKGMRVNTSDGSDNQFTFMTGGGGAALTRGGSIYCFGNEHATQAGQVWLVGGDVTGGDVVIHAEDGERGRFKAEGLEVTGTLASGAHTITVAGAAADGLILNNTNQLANFLMARGNIGGTPAGVTLITQGSTGFNWMTDSGNTFFWRKNSIAMILSYNFTDETTLMSLDPDGNLAITGNLIIPNNGFIGSVGDTDAFQIATGGDIVISQNLGVTGTIDAANYTADNLLTATATNAGELDFSVASKKLTVEDNAIVSQDYTSDASPTFAGLNLGTGELTAGSINRAADVLTLEIGGTPEVSIASGSTTLAGSLVFGADPATVTYGNAGVTDVLRFEGKGTILNTVNFASTEHANLLGMLLSSVSVGFSTAGILNFQSGAGDIAFIASTGGKSITLTSPAIHVVGASDFGDGTNEVQISSTGVLTFEGTGGLVIDKTSGLGIKVDNASPTFGWRDLEGFEIPDPTGGDRPTLSTYSGGSTKENAFSNGDVLRIRYHIPHDYVKGTDIFSHIHWSHNGTAISGTVVFGVTSNYAKGHNQANFGTEKSISIPYVTTDISTTPRYRHRIEEAAITSDGGSGTLIDRGLLEPDGIILVTFEMTTNPTITGGSPNNVFVHRADLHYQSTNIATKDKIPDFYT